MMRAINLGFTGFLDNAVRLLLEAVESQGTPLTTTFNDYRLIARPGDSVEAVLNDAKARNERQKAKNLRSHRNRKYLRRLLVEEVRKQEVRESLLAGEGITMVLPAFFHEFVRSAREADAPQLLKVACYAVRWARQMEADMAMGYEVEDVAERTSYLANLEDISGQDFGYAVGLLIACWEHGETLREWCINRYSNLQVHITSSEVIAPGDTIVVFLDLSQK